MTRSTPMIRRVKIPSQPRRRPGRRPPLDEMVLASAFHHVRDRLRSRVVGRARRQRLEFMLDDLLGAADLGLCLAVRSWTPTRGPLEPYAWLFVQRETGRELRRELRRRAAQGAAPEMLAGANDFWPDMPSEAPWDTALTWPRCDPHDLALALAHWRDGRSLRAIARAHHVSFRQVHQAVARVRGQVLGDMPKSRWPRDVSSDNAEAIATATLDTTNTLWN